ncbi:MAG: hypothetical protein CMO01_16205 [Thalassobius sp.]|nr:hypothetical protein [Thalassovita sp.]
MSNSNFKFGKMKSTYLLIVCFLITNCSKVSTDKDLSDKSIGAKLMLDGKVWMTKNLAIETPESYCQQDDTTNCSKLGRLYTWEAAKCGCNLLGDGWRLPTNEEWKTMAKQYGGIYDDSDDNGKLAYLNLTVGGKAAFNALLGGNREKDGSYERLGAHGFYWTITESDSTEAWFYNFAKGSTLLNRHTGDKQIAISVRCIKEK